MKNIYKNNETGRSMVEMLGVLAIIGVLSVGGIAGYSKAMTKFKISKSMDQVSMLVANIRTLYSGQKDYSGLNTEEAIKYGITPSEMTNADGKTLTNAFAGTATITASKTGGGAATAADSKSFTVVYNGLGQEACVALATADWGSGSSSGLTGMSVSNAALATVFAPAYTTTGTAVATDLPIALAQAAAKCTCATATCAIGWVYF